ncbi:NEDD8 ultimate buster 1 [Drosophila tropicalis]|uniref:NEDD8 ultimate buster 1 n=1 Tax=Drosophila tropicalis TaxID=46794 RepID=UPI0035AB9014
MSHIDNIFIQVRARLQAENIKLWEEPYYSEELGSIEAAMEDLALNYAQIMGHIDASHLKCVLTELQDNALRKLASRREFTETGVATFKLRRIDNLGGTTTMLDIKCDLNALGLQLQEIIAKKLQLSNANYVKCISGGKIVASNATLAAQQLRNNQQLMVIVGQQSGSDNQNGAALYERIQKIKEDVSAMVSSQNRMMEMEDQDGNPVFLPPAENRALLIGLGYCEKARSAMRREDYEESLLLLLEADEQFANCNSKFLESVDNYALLNLDIVWCYLCLKNVSQLPDAERRLNICERSFRRSYGENFNRLYALKGRSCPERALIMRLQLLQGVVFFHQNRRDEAYERFESAGRMLSELKVNEDQLMLLVEMGFDMSESRLALRSCSGVGNVERAVQFIHERRQQLRDARKQSKAERELQRQHFKKDAKDIDWVNPRSVCTLIEMGFTRRLATEALKLTKNDVPKAVELLQSHSEDLERAVFSDSSPNLTADSVHLAALQQLGFDEATSCVALESAKNNVEKAIEYLLKAFQSEDELKSLVKRITQLAKGDVAGLDGPSTSQQVPPQGPLINAVLSKAKTELEAYKAYKRFNSDLSQSDQDYLDLPLNQEEQLLAEYRKLLEQ